MITSRNKRSLLIEACNQIEDIHTGLCASFEYASRNVPSLPEGWEWNLASWGKQQLHGVFYTRAHEHGFMWRPPYACAFNPEAEAWEQRKLAAAFLLAMFDAGDIR